MDALLWDRRRLRILEEILVINPDILCMQEVDHFAFFRGILAAVGYKGLFFPKPDSPALYVEDTNGPDGCAMFYNMSKVNVKDEHTIVLKTMDEAYFTNQVSIIMQFGVKGASKDLYVATTHLKAKYGWEDLRHSQGTYLVNYLRDKVADQALVVCGDFNGDFTEPVYKSFKDSPLNLTSTYTLLSPDGAEPPYTTWKIRGGKGGEKDVCRAIDYMWYTKNSMTVDSVKMQPTDEEIGENRLPSYRYGSDHLSLAADYTVI